MAGYSFPAYPVNLCYRDTKSTLAPTGKCYYFIFAAAVNKPTGVTAGGRTTIPFFFFNKASQERVHGQYSQVLTVTATQQEHYSLIRNEGSGGARFWQVMSPPSPSANRLPTPRLEFKLCVHIQMSAALHPFAPSVFLGVNFIMEFPSRSPSLCSLKVRSHRCTSMLPNTRRCLNGND